MSIITLKRPLVTLAVAAGLLAAAGPASAGGAQIWAPGDGSDFLKAGDASSRPAGAGSAGIWAPGDGSDFVKTGNLQP